MGHPVRVDLNELFQRVHGKIHVDLGHGEPVVGIIEPLEVLLRPEQPDAAVLAAVGFQPFKGFLAVMEAVAGGA